MADIDLDYLSILRLFTAGMMCVGGIAFAVLYCCFPIQDIDDLLPKGESKKLQEEYLEAGEADLDEKCDKDEKGVLKNKAFWSMGNESCHVEDEANDGNGATSA